MFEPAYLPQLSPLLPSYIGASFGINHFRRLRLPEDPDIDPIHTHPYWELYFHISGKASFLINGHLYMLQPGDILIIQPNEAHMCIFPHRDLQEHYCLWMNLNGEYPLAASLAHGPLLRDQSVSYPTLSILLAKLWELQKIQGSELEQASAFLQVLTTLRKKQHTCEIASPLPSSLQAVLQDIDRNYLLIRNLSEITQRHFISPATLNRWFREHLHISPKAYLEYKKLSHAVQLLSNGASVTEACFGSGFSDCSHFCAQFKKQFGQTPLQYKKISE